ncbi:MAG TPA: acyl-CoA dehydrogenase family protein [Dehalococcoidia bacterium]|nr:acyl-CoA dehydrogenase family protein [Dehalococcoidia bacterium]
MTYFPLTPSQLEWQKRTRKIATESIGPRAASYDRNFQFPRESLEALRDAGLWALRVSREFGGLGADLLTTCLVVEEVSKKCPSTAMCYKMHLEATELLNLIPTPYQVEHFVKPLANGEVFATIAGGESSGTTGEDWRSAALEVTNCRRTGGSIGIDNLRKSYVTSAGQATHYTMFCRIEGLYSEGPPNLLLVESDGIEWEVLGAWNGLGMHGNSSSPMRFNGTVPEGNLLGADLPTATLWGTYLMPALVLTYGAAYLGIASGAFELACVEAAKRHPSGARRIDSPINQRRMAEMSTQIEAARALLHAAASAADQGRATSPLPFLQAKILCSEAAVRVTQDLMTMFGGTAFAARLPFERYFRDARAGMVMGVANDAAYQQISGMLFPDN